MKKVLFAATALIVSFSVGLAATYEMMPTYAPDLVATAASDSSNMMSTGANMQAPAATVILPDSLHASPMRDTTMTTIKDSMMPDVAHPDTALFRRLRDTVRMLRKQLAQERTQAATRSKKIKAFEKKVATLKDHHVQAAGLSGTLAKLEVRELRKVLRKLDMKTIEALYSQASGRNQKRLLQAMPSDRAAYFVNNMITTSPSSS